MAGFNPYNATARSSAIHRGEAVEEYRILEDQHAPPLLVVSCLLCPEMTVTRHPHLLHAMGWEVTVPSNVESWARIIGKCPACSGTSDMLEDLRCNCGEHVLAIADNDLLTPAGWEMKEQNGKPRLYCPECAGCSNHTAEHVAETHDAGKRWRPNRTWNHRDRNHE